MSSSFSKLAILWLVLAIVASFLWEPFACISSRKAKPVFHLVKDNKPNADAVALRVKGDALIVVVEHLGGIGKSEIVLQEGEWPTKLQFIFENFKALEGLKVRTASKQFESSISTSHKEDFIRLSDGFTATRKGDSIYIYGPHHFVKKDDKSLHVEWVDFYRH